MPIWDPDDAEQLTWRFKVVGDVVDFYDTPGAQLDAPQAWVEAVVATARDLRCLRYGRDVDPDRLMWELSIGPTYAVTIGWHGTAGITGFGLCQGLSMNTSFAEAAVWVADTAQAELTGYDFLQWPSRSRHLLLPRQVDDAAVWIDPHDDRVVSPIGGLGQVQMRGVTRSPRDSSGGYAVSAGATSSAGSVAVSAGLSPRAWERTSRPR